MAEKKTTSQVVYERIEELKAGGMSNADAIRKVAEDDGKTVNAVRANVHNYKKKLDGGSTSTRGASKPLTVDGALAEAKKLLERALKSIDSEVDKAKVEADRAQARYEELKTSVAQKKTELEQKIRAL
ncbi:MAG: hypothetical protein IPK93_12380 [Solirubrobacterales bacterium]|nr:hypothetical protein [Solirubrobacterales bacterium]